MLGLLRIIKFSLQDMLRNFSLALMTVLILVLMLLSVNTLLAVRVLTSEAVLAIRDHIDVSVYFAASATDEQVNKVTTLVRSFKEVKEAKLLNREETLARFKDIYKENPKILDSLNELGKNPLGATLIVKTTDPKDYELVLAALDAPEYTGLIEAKTFADTRTAIDKIHIITKQVEQFSLALSALFAIIAFIIVFNTVRVAIYTQRVEISIKKLVGASNWFVRGPYIIESAIFSIVAVGITYGVVRLSLGYLDPYVSTMFQKNLILTNYLNSHILVFAWWQFGAVLFLTAMTSMLAMRRYLKV